MMRKKFLQQLIQEQNDVDRQRGFAFFDESRVIRPLIDVIHTANAAGEINDLAVMQCLFDHARQFDHPLALKICVAMNIQQAVWVEFTVPWHEIPRDQYNERLFLAMQQCSNALNPEAAANHYIQQHFPRYLPNIEVDDFQHRCDG